MGPPEVIALHPHVAFTSCALRSPESNTTTKNITNNNNQQATHNKHRTTTNYNHKEQQPQKKQEQRMPPPGTTPSGWLSFALHARRPGLESPSQLASLSSDHMAVSHLFVSCFLLFLYCFLLFCSCFWDTQQMRNCKISGTCHFCCWFFGVTKWKHCKCL